MLEFNVLLLELEFYSHK